MLGYLATKGVTNLPVPKLSFPHDVLVKVKAFGINGPDLLQNAGKYPPPAGVTDILGLELSGTVVEANDQGKDLIGKDVCALVPGGAYAEYCVADARLCFTLDSKFPKDEKFVRSAGIPENLFTVWKNVFRPYMNDFSVLKNKSILFHGGSGGIGMTGITLARFFGVKKIITTAGNDEKCSLLKELGAHEALNYKLEGDKAWDAELANRIGKVDVIIDMVGGDYLQRNLNSLNPGGKIIVLGFLGKSGPVAKDINLGLLLVKNLTITGSVLRSNPIEEKTQLKNEIETYLWPKIASGEINLPANISHVFKGLDKTEEAIESVKASKHFGKIIVTLD